jgi:hypothetical protein
MLPLQSSHHNHKQTQPVRFLGGMLCRRPTLSHERKSSKTCCSSTGNGRSNRIFLRQYDNARATGRVPLSPLTQIHCTLQKARDAFTSLNSKHMAAGRDYAAARRP